MKTEKAVIKFALRAEENKDRTHNIVLRVQWQGKRKDKTITSCFKEQWDEAHKRVKTKVNGKFNKGAIITNELLNTTYNKVVAIRDGFILNNTPYTADDIINALKKDEKHKDKAVTINDVMKEFFNENRFSYNTLKSYKYDTKVFCTYFGNDRAMGNISKEDIKGWFNYMDDNDYKVGTKSKISVGIKTLFLFANDKGYINNVPFARYGSDNISKRWKNESKPKALTIGQYYLLLQYYRTIENKCDKKSNKLHSKYFILLFFLCGVKMQGLAPIDMAQITKKDIIDEDSERIVLGLHRQKTKKAVTVTIYKDMADELNVFLQRWKDGKDLLFPILDGVNLDDGEAKAKKVHSFLVHTNNYLKRIINSFNVWLSSLIESDGSTTVQYRAMGEICTETVTKDNVQYYTIGKEITLYSYRHTYATIYLTKGGNVYQLAKDLGRTIANIDEYIGSLNISRRKEDTERKRLFWE